MVMYSLVQYTTSTICYIFLTYPSDFQFLYWDLGCNFFFFLTYGLTKTARQLSSRKPKSTLFMGENMVGIFSFFIIQLLGQILIAFSATTIFPEHFELLYDSL
jgi:magnesium-transporting ATPase (P-type)